MIRVLPFSITLLLTLAHLEIGRAEEQKRLSPRSAVVIVDSTNPENITGKVSLALVWGERFSPPQDYLRGIINLKEAMLRWTRIETTVERHIMLSSPHIMDMPFLYVAVEGTVELSDFEKENLGKYLTGGGFMVVEDPNVDTEMNLGGTPLKHMIEESVCHNVHFQMIPNDHPLYHCFFDFTDGPPMIARTNPYLEGLWIGDRLAAVFSGRGYIIDWMAMDNNIPQLKMGVNMVVFSLIQDSVSGWIRPVGR